MSTIEQPSWEQFDQVARLLGEKLRALKSTEHRAAYLEEIISAARNIPGGGALINRATAIVDARAAFSGRAVKNAPHHSIDPISALYTQS